MAVLHIAFSFSLKKRQFTLLIKPIVSSFFLANRRSLALGGNALKGVFYSSGKYFFCDKMLYRRTLMF
jgi:hypothetical protein